ncbi:MAG TPA: hypothetical protein VE961_24805 [Pyrinomonadaceae bacterium]|nr:hypothetical protein [Pyrinomonadaceae bacterium]
MQTLHYRRRETFLRLEDLAATHTDIPATTVRPQLIAEVLIVISDLEGDVSDGPLPIGAGLERTHARGSATSVLREGVERTSETARGLNEWHFDDCC